MSDANTYSGNQGLGIGSLIGEAYSLTFRNILPLLAIFILPVVVMGVLGYFMFGNIALQAMTDPTAVEAMIQENMTQLLVMYVIFVIVMMVMFSFVYAAGISAFFDAKMGRGINLGRAFGLGFSRCIQLIVASIVLGLLVGIVFGIIGGVLMAAAAAIAPELAIVASIVIIVMSIYLYGLIAPFGAVVVVENRWVSAIGRTFGLTKGYRWPIIGLIIVFMLSLIVVYLLIALIGYVATLLGMVGVVIAMIVGLIGMVVIYGSGIAMISLLYARLREIKEGASLEAVADVFS